MWVIGNGPMSSARTASVLNHQVISPALLIVLEDQSSVSIKNAITLLGHLILSLHEIFPCTFIALTLSFPSYKAPALLCLPSNLMVSLSLNHLSGNTISKCGNLRSWTVNIWLTGQHTSTHSTPEVAKVQRELTETTGWSRILGGRRCRKEKWLIIDTGFL